MFDHSEGRDDWEEQDGEKREMKREESSSEKKHYIPEELDFPIIQRQWYYINTYVHTY